MTIFPEQLHTFMITLARLSPENFYFKSFVQMNMTWKKNLKKYLPSSNISSLQLLPDISEIPCGNLLMKW